MNEESNDHESKEEVTSTPQLVIATKDRVRGPQGRRLPQRKSMMQTSTPLEEDDVFKPRSFSLSGPNEAEESEDSPGENRRISLSLELVDQTDKSEDICGGGDNQQRSSSSHELPTQRSELHRPEAPKLAKKPIFGRLGGQHAALTKELELKLKSGLAPGGHRFHEPEEATSDTSALEKKVETLQSRIESMQNTIQSLQNAVDSMVNANASKSESDEQVSMTEIKQILAQATEMFKAAQETNKKSEQMLAEAVRTNAETGKLFRELERNATAEKPLITSSKNLAENELIIDEEISV